MRKRKVFGRIYVIKYSWKSHKGKVDTRTELKIYIYIYIKEVGKLGWFISKT